MIICAHTPLCQIRHTCHCVYRTGRGACVMNMVLGSVPSLDTRLGWRCIHAAAILPTRIAVRYGICMYSSIPCVYLAGRGACLQAIRQETPTHRVVRVKTGLAVYRGNAHAILFCARASL
jgi:hypothetical protein